MLANALDGSAMETWRGDRRFPKTVAVTQSTGSRLEVKERIEPPSQGQADLRHYLPLLGWKGAIRDAE